MTIRNIIITPIVLIRAIIMSIGLVLATIGGALWDGGDKLPGWHR